MFSQPLSCFRCHGGFTFSGATDFEGRREGGVVEFHNTGLYNLAGALSYPAPNTGIYEITRNPEDVGKFKAPTPRTIAVTAPYMHDGSAATLDDVIAHDAAGGRTIADRPSRGIGHDNPGKSPTVRGFSLSAEQRDDLIAFLRSLTDDTVLYDPRFSNPWKSGSSAHRPPTECTMTLSARNHLPGTIDDIQWGDVLVHVTVRVGEHIVDSVITRRSAEEMGLKNRSSRLQSI